MAGDALAHRGTKVLADHVQAEIDAGAEPGRGHHLAGVDVEGRRVDLDRREAARQLRSECPVRRRPSPVEQSGVGEGEGAGADGEDAGTALRCRYQGGGCLLRRR
jgi:hypothetical protein